MDSARFETTQSTQKSSLASDVNIKIMTAAILSRLVGVMFCSTPKVIDPSER